MPTRHWLLDPLLSRMVGRLESTGGVDQAEAAVGLAHIDSIHAAARAERHRASTRLYAVPDLPPEASSDVAAVPSPDSPMASEVETSAAVPAADIPVQRFDHPGGVGGTRVGVKCLHAHVAEWLSHGRDAVGEWSLRQLDLVALPNYQRVEDDGTLTTIRWPGPVGAIDIGTNTMSLLVADGTDQLVREIGFARLGEGIGATGRISDAAIGRAVDIARHYRRLMDQSGVTEVAAVATAAARAASNGADVVRAIGDALGATVRIIDGETEAQFAFAGATGGVRIPAGVGDLGIGDRGALVLDIGGGSTELTYGHHSVEASVSMPIGAVNLTEQYLLSDPPLPEELSACVTVARAHIDEALGQLPPAAREAVLIGIAGTVTTSAAVEIGLPEYDRDALHEFVLTKAAAEDVFRTLATETIEQRLDNPGMFPGRERIIVGGCCVLVSVLRALGAESILVSEANLLDGVAAAASASTWPVEALRPSAPPTTDGQGETDGENGTETDVAPG